MSEMVAVTPLSAKRLIEELLEQEVLMMQTVQRTLPGPPAIFSKSKPIAVGISILPSLSFAYKQAISDNVFTLKNDSKCNCFASSDLLFFVWASL